jgi:hypothetical protein
LLARFANVAGGIGWTRALLVAPLWLVWKRYWLLEARLEEASVRPAAPAESERRLAAAGLSSREISAGEVELLLEVNPLLPIEEATRRLAEGHRCTLFWQAGAPVHYRWAGTGPVRLPVGGLTLVPEAGDYLAIEVWTRSSARRQGIQSLCTEWSTGQALSWSASRKLVFVAWWNRPSLTANRVHGGFRRAGTFSQWGWGRLGGCTVSGRARLAGKTLRLPHRPPGEGGGS